MEELNWENISDVSTGTPSSIWDITDQDNSHEFSILTDCADCHPHDATNNSEENTEEYQTVALDNEDKVFYDYNLGLNSAASRRHQQGDLRITSGISCFNNPFIMLEQAFHHELPVEAAGNSVNCFSFPGNSSDDELSSSQIRLANDHKNSIISSKRSFYAASRGAISSESAEPVSQSFHHQLRKQKKPPPPETTDCSNPNDLFLSGYQSDSLRKSGGFKLIAEDYSTNQKKPIWQNLEKSSKINFSTPQSPSLEPDTEAIAAMKEIMYREAVLRPVNQCPEAIDQKPKRKNVKTSSEPQTVAARQRRERISDKIRILQRLVPGGTKMDTATMLDEAANYLKFLKSQVNLFQSLGGLRNNTTDYQQELYRSPPSPIFK